MTVQSSYDVTPFPSYAIRHTHPATLATLGHLMDIDVAPVRSCRVLELGVGTGRNLLAMAEQLPDSRFLGIDLSPVQIDLGNAFRAELGLTNVELRHQSILDFDGREGVFDYIICHGVYSWSPPAVQERTLDICRQHLAPDGMVSISYNCLPGWSLAATFREVARAEVPPNASSEECREWFFDFLDRLDVALTDAKGARAVLMRGEIELARTGIWDYLIHEFFEEYNEPLIVRELVERAARHELTYLSDLLWSQRGQTHWTASNADPPESYEELIRREQFEDFVVHRRFRSTALVHADTVVRRKVEPERLYGLFVSCNPKELEMDLEVGRPTRVARNGRDAFALSAGADAVLQRVLKQWPVATAFEELWQHAVGSPPDGAERDDTSRRALAAELLELYMGEVLDLHSYAPPIAFTVEERPRVRPLNRVEASHAPFVTSGWHVKVELDPVERALIAWMDGTKTQAELEAMLEHAIETKWRGASNAAKPAAAGRTLKRCLMKFSYHGLLME